MALTRSGLYIPAHRDSLLNDIALDYVADSIKGVPVDNSITPNFTTDTAYGAGAYTGAAMLGSTAGGVALTTPTLTASTDYLVFDAADWTYASQTFTAYGAVFYDDTLAGKNLLFLVYFGGAAAVSGGDFKIVWDATGIWRNRLAPAA